MNKENIIKKWKPVVDMLDIKNIDISESLCIFSEYYSKLNNYKENNNLPLCLQILKKINLDNKILIVDINNEFELNTYQIEIKLPYDFYDNMFGLDIKAHIESTLINEVVYLINKEIVKYDYLIINANFINIFNVLQNLYINCVYNLKFINTIELRKIKIKKLNLISNV